MLSCWPCGRGTWLWKLPEGRLISEHQGRRTWPPRGQGQWLPGTALPPPRRTRRPPGPSGLHGLACCQGRAGAWPAKSQDLDPSHGRCPHAPLSSWGTLVTRSPRSRAGAFTAGPGSGRPGGGWATRPGCLTKPLCAPGPARGPGTCRLPGNEGASPLPHPAAPGVPGVLSAAWAGGLTNAHSLLLPVGRKRGPRGEGEWAQTWGASPGAGAAPRGDGVEDAGGGGGHLPPLSQGGWEAGHPWWEDEASLRGPLTPLLSLQGSRGPKGYKVSVAWARVLPGASVRLGLTRGLCASQGEKGKRGVDGMDGMKVSPPGCWGPGHAQGTDSGRSRGPQTWQTGASSEGASEVPAAPKPSGQARRSPGRGRPGPGWVSHTCLPLQGETGYPGLPGCKGSPGFDVSRLLSPIR